MAYEWSLKKGIDDYLERAGFNFRGNIFRDLFSFRELEFGEARKAYISGRKIKVVEKAV
jgi:hypothetical protein